MSFADQPTQAVAVALPLTTFTLFADLPIEIRAMVWKHTMPGARPIKMYAGPCWPGEYIPTLQANFAVPTLLRVCLESREVGRRAYKLLFLEHGDRERGHKKNLYVDFDQDTVYIQDLWSLLRLSSPFWNSLTGHQHIQQHLRHLVVGDFRELSQDPRVITHIREFSGLKSVTLIINEGSSAEVEDARQESVRQAIRKDRPQMERPRVTFLTAAQIKDNFRNERNGA